MHFHIKHVTRYTYSRPVFCEPLTLRLRPREDVTQKLVQYRLSVDPQPAGVSEMIDLDGNSATRVWFDRLTLSLSITTSAVVETLRANPFDFLIEPEAVKLPLRYPESLTPLLAPYSTPLSVAGAVDDFAKGVAAEYEWQTIPVLTGLAARIHAQCPTVHRDQGDPWPASTTLTQGRGACRDLAVLFNEACRSLGLACRFVSGYHTEALEGEERHLHAWSEVYLPGAGWRGFDPALGLAVADQHVALAAGPTWMGASPTAGAFRGTDAISTLATQIVIDAERRT